MPPLLFSYLKPQAHQLSLIACAHTVLKMRCDVYDVKDKLTDLQSQMNRVISTHQNIRDWDQALTVTNRQPADNTLATKFRTVASTHINPAL